MRHFLSSPPISKIASFSPLCEQGDSNAISSAIANAASSSNVDAIAKGIATAVASKGANVDAITQATATGLAVGTFLGNTTPVCMTHVS